MLRSRPSDHPATPERPSWDARLAEHILAALILIHEARLLPAICETEGRRSVTRGLEACRRQLE
jgi:hypothetical protein